ncbi:hypothetical protein SUGI_1128970 [Cryptomeria japonica]|nr:hypothetical protein SUGI_1128970 [Cryptomeria japonica]
MLIAKEVKLGVEVSRNEEDDSFSKEEISKAVHTLMVEEEGKRIRSHAQEIGGVLTRNNCQIHRSNVDNCLSLMKEKRNYEPGFYGIVKKRFQFYV